MIGRKSLALKMRPGSWAEVVGQNTVVSILSRQIATGTFKNAYLFAGASGCGKTTVARIFTKYVHNGEGEPIELDAASNNGIDSIRAIINDAQQLAMDSDYKVYIIDECHQLTKAAWDAALKLIEEPPSHSIFIFCTTNILKVPETILSRVQRYDFKKVPNNVIADRLEFILNEEVKVDKYERLALDRIAEQANGNVREAITMLDTCLSYNDDVTLSNVEAVLGLVQYESIINLYNGLIEKDMSKCVNEIDNFKNYNIDILKVFDSLISFALDCAVYLKTRDFDISGLSRELKDKVSLNDSTRANLLVDRLVSFRVNTNQSNAVVMLKAIAVEFCAG